MIGSYRPYVDRTGRCHVGAIYVYKAWHGKRVAAAHMERILAGYDPNGTSNSKGPPSTKVRHFYTVWGLFEQPGSEALCDGLIEEVTMLGPTTVRWADVGCHRPDLPPIWWGSRFMHACVI